MDDVSLSWLQVPVEEKDRVGRGKQGNLREPEPWQPPPPHSQEGVLGHAAVQLHSAACQVPHLANGDPHPTDSRMLEPVESPLHRDGTGSHIRDLKAFHRTRSWPEQAERTAVIVGHPIPSPCAPKGGPAGTSGSPSPVEQLSAASPTELMLSCPLRLQAAGRHIHLPTHRALCTPKAVPSAPAPHHSSKGAVVPRPGPNQRIIKVGRDLEDHPVQPSSQHYNP